MRRGAWKTPSLSGTDAEAVARAKTSALQATRQRNGAKAEERVVRAMRERGDVMVEKTEVPFRMGKDGKLSARRKVSGDFRAVRLVKVPVFHDGKDSWEVGLSVLVEVKKADNRLCYGDFAPHQIEALNAHNAAHGITEVAWVDRGEVRFVPWARFIEIGFRRGMSVVWNGTAIEIYRGKE
jgi:hypothetical protein